MNFFSKLILFGGLLVVSQFAVAQDYTKISDIKSIEAKVNASSNQTNTIKSDFKQIKHLDVLETTIESVGKFWFRKENFLRWEYLEPYKYLIAINGEKFTIKDESKVSEFDTESNKVFKEINNLIVSSVRGNLLMDNNFSVEAFENAKFYKVVLTPKIVYMKEILSSIEMYFDKSDMSVSIVRMIENEGDYTEIEFTNKRFNEEIPADIFIVK